MSRCLAIALLVLLVACQTPSVGHARANLDSTPSPVVAASPAAGTSAAVLIDAVLANQPVGHIRITVDRWTFQPGPAALEQAALGGPVLLAVETGRIVATFAGTEQTVETGGMIEIPPGTDYSLRNPDPTEAVAVDVQLIPTAFVDYAFDPVSIRLEDPIEQSSDGLPAGPIRVVLERWILAPGAGLPPHTAGEWDWFGVVEGRAALRLQGETLPFRWTDGEEREFGALQALPGVRAGTTVTLRNAAERPLVIFHLTIKPDE